MSPDEKSKRPGGDVYSALESLLQALISAGAYRGQVKDRYDDFATRVLYALTAGGKHDERLRTVANRFLGKPDRQKVPKPSARYNAKQIVQDYKVLITGEGDRSLYHTWRQCGLQARCEIKEHKKVPRKGCVSCDPERAIRLPLEQREAVDAIMTVHGFSSWIACLGFLMCKRRDLPERDRFPLPGMPTA